jgi:glycerophosphoryl diester phosphodiesterase
MGYVPKHARSSVLRALSVMSVVTGLSGVGAGLALADANDKSSAENRDGRGTNGRVSPIVIGHRGASGYRPEHTLASYRLAIDLGADFIEPDCVSTRDGRLVARHENEISGTTDVADHPEFAARKATKTIDGTAITGWFTEDFTLAEIKTLRAKERLPAVRPINATFDGEFEIPTLEEVIELAQTETKKRGRTIGVYPETKHPTYFQSIGLPLEEPLVKILHTAGYRDRRHPVFIQSFETKNLRKLRGLTRLRLVQLVDASGAPYDLKAAGETTTYADLVTKQGLARVAQYADGVGAHKNLLVPRDSTQKLLAATTVIADAHAQGLVVHSWTFRAENQFLPLDYRVGDPSDPAYPNVRGDLQEEVKLFIGLGLDGLFSDNPDIAVAARAGLGL